MYNPQRVGTFHHIAIIGDMLDCKVSTIDCVMLGVLVATARTNLANVSRDIDQRKSGAL